MSSITQKPSYLSDLPEGEMLEAAKEGLDTCVLLRTEEFYFKSYEPDPDYNKNELKVLQQYVDRDGGWPIYSSQRLREFFDRFFPPAPTYGDFRKLPRVVQRELSRPFHLHASACVELRNGLVPPHRVFTPRFAHRDIDDVTERRAFDDSRPLALYDHARIRIEATSESVEALIQYFTSSIANTLAIHLPDKSEYKDLKTVRIAHFEDTPFLSLSSLEEQKNLLRQLFTYVQFKQYEGWLGSPTSKDGEQYGRAYLYHAPHNDYIICNFFDYKSNKSSHQPIYKSTLSGSIYPFEKSITLMYGNGGLALRDYFDFMDFLHERGVSADTFCNGDSDLAPHVINK